MSQVRQQVSAATARLAAAGAASPRVDAELLLAHVLGRSRSQLMLLDELTADAAARFNRLIERRLTGEPVQHLTGTAPFRYLELAVGPGVFIPRPETELILELAGEPLAGRPTVVDLCAGSGAIALSVAHEHPGTRVIAVERCEPALVWLRRNAESRALAGDSPIEVIAGDVADPTLLAGLDGTVDVILSNPPYVPEVIRADLGPEIEFDPATAVFAGPDGLALLPGLLRTAARLLGPGGFLAVEHDVSHGAAVPELLRATGEWTRIEDHRDLTGRARFATGYRLAGRQGQDVTS